jgi:2-polyprenyl-3-methyl-5-hydroxy-6-metoxy-1,4-benzoquinol methylase
MNSNFAKKLPMQTVDELMLRGERLRTLRLIALEDEEERNLDIMRLQDEIIPFADCTSIVNIEFVSDNLKQQEIVKELSATTVSTSIRSLVLEDRVDVLPDSKMKVLRYDSFLAHQRYSDDYKHSHCNFIDFRTEASNKRIVTEQQRCLGKGGLLWDAAIVLSEHVIAHQDDWRRGGGQPTKIVDMGAGTGFVGISIARTIPGTEVSITDLPEMLPLMQRNVERNFESRAILKDTQMESRTFNNRGDAAEDIPFYTDKGCMELSDSDNNILYDVLNSADVKNNKESSEGKVMANVLRWGVKEDYANAPYDVIVAADVVTSLYSPIALAETIHDLCHKNTKVYISAKRRLEGPHVVFEEALKQLFSSVVFKDPVSRRKNDAIAVIEATGKK